MVFWARGKGRGHEPFVCTLQQGVCRYGPTRQRVQQPTMCDDVATPAENQVRCGLRGWHRNKQEEETPVHVLACLPHDSKGSYRGSLFFHFGEATMIDQEKLRAANIRLAQELGRPVPAHLMSKDETAVDEFKATLPLVLKDQEGVPMQFVDMYHLHSALGIATRPRQWFVRAIEMYSFVEDEDYIKTAVDGSTAEGRAQLKAGVTFNYLLTLDMAKELCMVQKSTMGRQVRKYFLIAERVAKKHAAKEFAAALDAAKEHAQVEHRKFLEADKIATAAALKAGFKSGTDALIAFETNERAQRHKRAEKAATGAGLFMWEQVSAARRYLAQKRTAEALGTLAEVEQAYGAYSDMARDCPPWTDEQ